MADEVKSPKARAKAILLRRVPILEWMPKYDRETALADLIAGISLGLTLIPQSIAYASLANLGAEYGLYSSFMGTMLYAVFGTVKEVSIGPTSLMALLILQYCKNLSVDYVILLGFLSGVVVILMGVLRLGSLVELISLPVTSGFTSATASVIIVSQIKGILGIRFKAENFVDNVVQLYRKYPMAKLWDIVLGACCMAFLLAFRKLKDIPVKNVAMKKTLWFISLSRNALVVVMTAFVAYRLHSQGGVPFNLSDRMSVGLPAFRMPKFSVTEGNKTTGFIEMCGALGSGILVVPLTAVLANVAIAKAFTCNKKVDATQEMITLGLCQVMGAFVQSMPSTGAFTRSAVSHASGVRTPFSGVYSGIITLMALTLLTHYFAYIPKATLSAVLICAVVFMIDLKILRDTWRGNRWDTFALLVTYAVSLLKGVEVGLLVGVAVNVSYLVYTTARPGVSIARKTTSTGCEYVLLTPEAGLYHMSVSFLRDVIRKAASVDGENVLPVVVDCSKFQTIDYTACKGLDESTEEFERRNQRLVFVNVSKKVASVLSKNTEMDSRLYESRDEDEMTDALFGAAGEKTPLLSDTFARRDADSDDADVVVEMKPVPVK